MSLSVHPFVDEASFWNHALQRLLGAVERAIAVHGHARIGIAGGTTPLSLYCELAGMDLPWDKITWILVDERYVSPEDEESNLGALRRTLWQGKAFPSEHLLHFDTNLNAEEAVSQMRHQLQTLEKLRTPLFDFLLLGVGADGHLASLFEGETTLFGGDYAYVTEARGYATNTRLTVSLHALTHAEEAVILLLGAQKRAVLHALQGTGQLPLTVLHYLSQKIPVTILSFMEEQ